MTTTVPRTISIVWPVLRGALPTAEQPRYVAVRPDPAARIDDCFFNVAEVVSRSGGSIVTAGRFGNGRAS